MYWEASFKKHADILKLMNSVYFDIGKRFQMRPCLLKSALVHVPRRENGPSKFGLHPIPVRSDNFASKFLCLSRPEDDGEMEEKGVDMAVEAWRRRIGEMREAAERPTTRRSTLRASDFAFTSRVPDVAGARRWLKSCLRTASVVNHDFLGEKGLQATAYLENLIGRIYDSEYDNSD